MLGNVWFWLGVALGVTVAVVVLLLGLRRRRGDGQGRGLGLRRRPHRNEFRPEGIETPEPLRRAAVVVDPSTSTDLEAVRVRVTTAMRAEGLGEPLWYEATVADPGTGQARRALDDGAVLVCALGGDGTVRAVARGLAGSDIPLGVLPGGLQNSVTGSLFSGSLFARSLDLPVDSLERALSVALTGQNHRVDVGRLEVTRPHGGTTEEHVFLVRADVGHETGPTTDPSEVPGPSVRPKADIDALAVQAASVVSGARRLVGPAFPVRIGLGGGTPSTRRARTVVIGNVGRLADGPPPVPDAVVDDGLLDLVVVSPRGPAGWASVVTRFVTRGRRGHARVDHVTAAEVELTLEHPEGVRVDGDPIGPACSVRAVADHLALVVRVAPRP